MRQRASNPSPAIGGGNGDGISKRRRSRTTIHQQQQQQQQQQHEWINNDESATLSARQQQQYRMTTIELPPSPPVFNHHSNNNNNKQENGIYYTSHAMSDAQYARSTRYQHYQPYSSSSSSYNNDTPDNNILPRHKQPPPPFMTPQGCVSVCALFSFIAVVFLLFIGILLDTQPLYIQGALTVQQTYITNANNRIRTRPVHLVPLERLPAATTAYRTALVYFLVFVSCRCYLQQSSSSRHNKQQQYQHIPELDGMLHDNDTAVTTPLRRQFMSRAVVFHHRIRVEWKRWWMEYGWYKSNNNEKKKHTPKTI